MKVLAGYDGSDRGRDAVALAQLLAGVENASLIVAVAFRPPLAADVEWFPPDHAATYERATREGAERLAEDARQLAPEAEVRTVAASSPARALYDAAERENAGIVIVGSSHRGALGRIVPGSVAEHMLSGGPCPIAVAPAGFADRTANRLHRIGVAYDASPEAAQALATAEQLGAHLHAQLTIVLVSEPSRIGAPYGGGYEAATLDRAIEDRARADLDAAVAASPNMLAAQGDLRKGLAADELAAATRNLDLLVCGSRGYGPLRRVLLGSVTARLIRHAHCPVLVIPRGSGGALVEDQT